MVLQYRREKRDESLFVTTHQGVADTEEIKMRSNIVPFDFYIYF